MAPFPSLTDTIIAALTDDGREMLARASMGDISWKWAGFKVGREGYLDANPVKVDPLVSSLTDLVDPVFPIPTTAIQPFIAVETPYTNVAAPVARLDRLQATYGLGELGLWGIVVYSVIGTLTSGTVSTVGSLIMVAQSHFPLKGKTDKDVFVLRTIVSV